MQSDTVFSPQRRWSIIATCHTTDFDVTIGQRIASDLKRYCYQTQNGEVEVAPIATLSCTVVVGECLIGSRSGPWDERSILCPRQTFHGNPCVLSVLTLEDWHSVGVSVRAPTHSKALSYDRVWPISCYGSRRTLISPADYVLRLMRITYTGFLSGTRHSPMVTSESVCPTTVPGGGGLRLLVT